MDTNIDRHMTALPPLPDDMLTVVACYLDGRARPVCRAFLGDQLRVSKALASLPHDPRAITEVVVGRTRWTFRVWWEAENEFTVQCEGAPYALVRRAVMCLPLRTQLLDATNMEVLTTRAEWHDPDDTVHPGPDLCLIQVPLRVAANFLANVGEVHDVRYHTICSHARTSTSPPKARSRCFETFSVPKMAMRRLLSLGAKVPPPLIRLPCGTWFRGGVQLKEGPPDLTELTRPLRALGSHRMRHLCYNTCKTVTVLNESPTLAELAKAAYSRRRF